MCHCFLLQQWNNLVNFYDMLWKQRNAGIDVSLSFSTGFGIEGIGCQCSYFLLSTCTIIFWSFLQCSPGCQGNVYCNKNFQGISITNGNCVKLVEIFQRNLLLQKEITSLFETLCKRTTENLRPIFEKQNTKAKLFL